MAKKAHGWTNDETWQIASFVDNHPEVHQEVMDTASYYMSDAIDKGAKTRAEVERHAVVHLAMHMHKRFDEVHDRVSSIVYETVKRLKGPASAAERDIAGALLMLARVGVQEVNWKEIARAHVSML